MFASATLKLTVWYLVILTVICLIFSFIIYELSTSEISSRLQDLQIRVEGSSRTLTLPGPVTLNDIRVNQTREAKASIFIGLVYMNLAVVGVGGIGSYLLARRTLKPIEEAHESQSRFTSDASHELRTPLAVMKSEIQVAMRDPNMKTADYREVLESNLEEVDKLTQLSQALLQLSRVEYDAIERSDRIDIAKTIKKAARGLDVPKNRMSYVLPERPVVIDGNEPMIVDLLRILLDNAVKYSPAGTPIVFELSSDGRNCHMVITNQGDGIDTKHQNKIFDRFYRVDTSRTSSTTVSGYGLGLSLAKKIVGLHDGTISARSTPGKSTSLKVVLPHVRKNR
jgi:signal transduction histidine kinase